MKNRENRPPGIELIHPNTHFRLTFTARSIPHPLNAVRIRHELEKYENPKFCRFFKKIPVFSSHFRHFAPSKPKPGDRKNFSNAENPPIDPKFRLVSRKNTFDTTCMSRFSQVQLLRICPTLAPPRPVDRKRSLARQIEGPRAQGPPFRVGQGRRKGWLRRRPERGVCGMFLLTSCKSRTFFDAITLPPDQSRTL